MGEVGPLKSLEHRLAERAGLRVLETKLVTVGSSLSDPDAASLLFRLSRQTETSTLGELLETLALNGGVENGVRSQLEAALLQWAEESRRRWRRHRGTASAAGVEEPSDGAEELLRWAGENEVDHCLELSGGRLLPWIRDDFLLWSEGELDDLTVAECLRGDHGSPMRREGLRSAARAFLWYCAGRQQVESIRSRLWSRRLDGPVLPAFSRLMRLQLRRITALPGGEAPVIFSEAPITIDDEPPQMSVRFIDVDSGGGEVETSLSLAEIDQGYLGLRCSCALGDSGGCAHRRVVLEWALDILHDGGDPLHRRMIEVAGQPGWSRLVDALRLGAREEGERASPAEELIWRLGGQGREIVIQPAIRRRTKTGRWRRGRSLSVRQCLEEGEGLSSSGDRQILSLLAVAEMVGTTRRAYEFRAYGIEGLVGHTRVFSLSQPSRAMVVERVRPVIAFVPNEDGYRLALRLGGHLVPSGKIGDYRLDQRHLVVMDEDAGRCAVSTLSAEVAELIRAIERFRGPLPLESHGVLLDGLTPYQPDVELAVPAELRGEIRPAASTVIVRFEPLDSGGLDVSLRVRPIAGGRVSWPPGEGPETVYGRAAVERFCVRRDLAEEQRQGLGLLTRLGLDVLRSAGSYRWHLESQEAALDVVAAVHEQGDRLEQQWVDGTAGWQILGVSLEDLLVRVERGSECFGVEGELVAGGERISLEVLLAAARSGARYVQLALERFLRLEAPLFEWLRQADDLLFQGRRGLSLGTSLIERAVALFDGVGSFQADEAWDELLARVAEARELELVVPEGLGVPLRSYQVEGYRWMARRSHWSAGVCLADDLGLGKVAQTVAVLQLRASRGPALVVTSEGMVASWLRDIRRVSPSLRPVRYHGRTRRAQVRKLEPGDVMVASYRALAREVELLESRRFSSFVLDNARRVSNSQSRRARAASRIRASFRLALLSTPLEGRLSELWSVFNVVNPGHLGSWEHFVARFATPIERDGDAQRRRALDELLSPFVLRRERAQVCDDLPALTETALEVEGADEERRAYDGLRRAALAQIEEAGPAKTRRRRAAIEAFTRLRQQACHPRITASAPSQLSSKQAAVLELLDLVVDQGFRAMLTCPDPSHSALMREALACKRLESVLLDDELTEDERQWQLSRWREGGAPIVLLGAEAVIDRIDPEGTDYVFHLDPWWCPSIEATGGVVRPVTVVRVALEGTIEAAALDLAARRRRRDASPFEEPTSALSLDELSELIRWGEADVTEGRTKRPAPLGRRASGKRPAPLGRRASGKRQQKRQETILLQGQRFPDLAERFVEHLDEERRKGLIRTNTTVAVYRRAVGRFADFVALRAEDELPLARWGELYLEALRSGEFQAPRSEASIARTVLRRLERFIASER